MYDRIPSAMSIAYHPFVVCKKSIDQYPSKNGTTLLIILLISESSLPDSSLIWANLFFQSEGIFLFASIARGGQ